VQNPAFPNHIVLLWWALLSSLFSLSVFSVCVCVLCVCVCVRVCVSVLYEYCE